jgi:protein involved in polysaccharide export with SLBB domain
VNSEWSEGEKSGIGAHRSGLHRSQIKLKGEPTMNEDIIPVVEPGYLFRAKLGKAISVLAGLTLLLCDGCQSHSPTPLPNEPTAETPVKLSAGDAIKLSFPGASELNQSQKIRVDGKVSLPLVGEVTAAGKTLVNFQRELAGLYKSQLTNSEVLVTLESGVANVVVSGFVGKPGKLTFDRPTTVFQAIMQAGGVSQYGSLSNIHLIRTVGGEQRSQTLDLRPAMRGKTTQVNYVKDGDVIYVSQKLF